MSKAATFTLTLEPDLHADFIAAAEASLRPAPEVVRDLMRDFVQHQREQRARAAFLQHKVDIARKSARQGLCRSNAEVEAAFAARRARITDEA